MDRTVITSEKFVGNVVSRLVQHYDRVFVERDEKNRLMFRVVATHLRAPFSWDDFGGSNPVVVTGFTNPSADGTPTH